MKPSILYKKLLNNLIVLSILILVFFYDVFNTIFGYLDEILALFFTLYIVFTLLLKKIYLYKTEINIAILLFIILILGLYSNYHAINSGFSTPSIAIVGDIINVFKAYAVYFGIRIMYHRIDSEQILFSLSKYSEFIFIVLLFLLFVDFIFDLFPHYQRFGIQSYQLFFTHASRYSFAISFIFFILFTKYYPKKKWVLLFILSIGLLSLRVKFFAFYLITIVILFFGKRVLQLPKKTFFIFLGVFTFIIFLLFKFQFEMYFSSGSGWSRGEILKTSFKIGKDFFPLGTGFGTYSSYFSGKYYSWVYGHYNIDDVYGISKIYWGFIADQFWPMVLGQFGYFGLISYLAIIYQYILLFINNYKSSINSKQRQYMFISILGMLLLLIDSSSDAIFTQNRAVVMFSLFALLINSHKKYNVHSKK